MNARTMVGAGALALAAGLIVSAPAEAALTLIVAAGGGGGGGLVAGNGGSGQIVASGSDGSGVDGGAGGANGFGGFGGLGSAGGNGGGGGGWLGGGSAGLGGGGFGPGGAGGGIGTAGGFGGGGGSGTAGGGGGGGYSGGGGGGSGGFGTGGGGGSYVNPVLSDVLENAAFNGSNDIFTSANGYAEVGLSFFSYTGGIQEYTIPQTAFYFVSAIGAQGGASVAGVGLGGYGAGVGGEVYLTQGTELDIVVGGAGVLGMEGGGGGGGGSFVWDPIAIPPQPAVPEPSTWAMMLIGFAGLGYAGYRRAQGERPAPAPLL